MPAPSKLALRYGFSAAILILVIACARTPPSRRVDRMTPAHGAILQVTNKSFDDLQLFLIRNGTAVRVGSVLSLSTHVVWISDAQLGDGGELELLAKPRSSFYAPRSAVFTASAGQRIAWVVEDRAPSDVVIVR